MSEDNELDVVNDKLKGNVDFNLGYLSLYDSCPISSAFSASNITAKDRESILYKTATRDMQKLLNKLFKLPKASLSTLTSSGDKGSTESGASLVNLVTLPDPIHRVPRQKPPPAPRPETKWERFARMKGIKKNKRERMVWDETSNEWRPRYGYKRVNDENDVPFIEHGPNDDPYEDPFQAKRDEKKLRVLKNKERQLKNQEFRQGKTKKVPSGIPKALGVGRTMQLGKEGTKEVLEKAQVSTASMGKFDRRRKNEPAPHLGNPKQKFRGNTGKSNVSSDKESDERIISRMFNKRAPTKDIPMSVSEGGTPYLRRGTSEEMAQSERAAKKRKKR